MFTLSLSSAASDFFDFRIRSVGIEKDKALVAKSKKLVAGLGASGYSDQIAFSHGDAAKIPSFSGVNFVSCYLGPSIPQKFKPNPAWLQIMTLSVASKTVVMIFDFQLKPQIMKEICLKVEVPFTDWFLTKLKKVVNQKVAIQVFVWTRKRQAWASAPMCKEISALVHQATSLTYKDKDYLQGLEDGTDSEEGNSDLEVILVLLQTKLEQHFTDVKFDRRILIHSRKTKFRC